MRTDKTERNSLSKHAFLQLRENILNGTYPSGYALIETKLAQELGVSRTPIREALHQLEQEGLAVSLPNRGVVVKTPSSEDFEDIYTVRQLLEGQAARWVCERARAEDIDQLGEIIVLMELYTNRNDSKNLARLDTEFHNLLYDACDSRILKQTLQTLHANSIYMRSKNLNSHKRATQSFKEHRAIYEAIVRRDADTASDLLTQHIANAHTAIHD